MMFINETIYNTRVDGTSVGALNGFAVINDNVEFLSEIWNNITSINDLFSSWSESYMLMNIYHIIMVFIKEDYIRMKNLDYD